MGMANNHRAHKATPEQYAKPWKLGRKLGKWLKCAVCHPRTNHKTTYSRAKNKRATREAE